MSPGEMLTVSDVDRWGIKKMTKKKPEIKKSESKHPY